MKKEIHRLALEQFNPPAGTAPRLTAARELAVFDADADGRPPEDTLAAERGDAGDAEHMHDADGRDARDGRGEPGEGERNLTVEARPAPPGAEARRGAGPRAAAQARGARRNHRGGRRARLYNGRSCPRSCPRGRPSDARN